MPKKATASKPVTTSSVETTLTTKTIEGRKAYVEWALSREDNRLYVPFDLATLLPLVNPDDRAKLEKRLASKKQGTVEIDLSQAKPELAREFLRSWIRANGKNRDRRKEHYVLLAESFRHTFVVEGTNFVVDANGMVVDAGHSGVGLVLAYYPKEWLDGLEPKEVYKVGGQGDDGKKVNSTVSSTSADGKALLATGNYCDIGGVVWTMKDHSDYAPQDWEWSESGQPPKGVQVTLRVTINTQPNRALKLAETRLPATLLDYIRSVGPLRELIDSSVLPVTISSKISEILRLWYMRVNHVMKDGNITTFGYVGKGGKLTLEDGPSWLLVAIGDLVECTELLKNSQGHIAPWGGFTPVKQVSKGGVSTAIGLAAMMVSDQSGRERIAKMLRMLPSEFAKGSEEESIKDASVVPLGESTLSNDILIQALVNYGKGEEDCIELAKARSPHPTDAKATIPQWQLLEGRVNDTWDSHDSIDLEDGSLSFVQFLVEQQGRCNELLGKEGKKQASAAVSRKLGKTSK